MKKTLMAAACAAPLLLAACGGDTVPRGGFRLTAIDAVAIDAGGVSSEHTRKEYTYLANGRLSMVTVSGPKDNSTGLAPILYYSVCSYEGRSMSTGFRDRSIEMRNDRIDAPSHAGQYKPLCADGSTNDDGKIVEKIYRRPTTAELTANANAPDVLVDSLTLELVKAADSNKASGSKLTLERPSAADPAQMEREPLRHHQYLLHDNGGLRGIVTDEAVFPAGGTPVMAKVAYEYLFSGIGSLSLRNRIDIPDPSVADPEANPIEAWMGGGRHIESTLSWEYPNANAMTIKGRRILGGSALSISCQKWQATDGRTSKRTTATAAVSGDWCADTAPRIEESYVYTFVKNLR